MSWKGLIRDLVHVLIAKKQPKKPTPYQLHRVQLRAFRANLNIDLKERTYRPKS